MSDSLYDEMKTQLAELGEERNKLRAAIRAMCETECGVRRMTEGPVPECWEDCPLYGMVSDD